MRSDAVSCDIPIIHHAIVLFVQYWPVACLAAADQEFTAPQPEADVAVSKSAVAKGIHTRELQGVQHSPPAFNLGAQTGVDRCCGLEGQIEFASAFDLGCDGHGDKVQFQAVVG